MDQAKLEEWRPLVRQYIDAQLRWSACRGESPEERAACYEEGERRAAIAERAKIVAWLREITTDEGTTAFSSTVRGVLGQTAFRIERADHQTLYDSQSGGRDG